MRRARRYSLFTQVKLFRKNLKTSKFQKFYDYFRNWNFAHLLLVVWVAQLELKLFAQTETSIFIDA